MTRATSTAICMSAGSCSDTVSAVGSADKSDLMSRMRSLADSTPEGISSRAIAGGAGSSAVEADFVTAWASTWPAKIIFAAINERIDGQRRLNLFNGQLEI